MITQFAPNVAAAMLNQILHDGDKKGTHVRQRSVLCKRSTLLSNQNLIGAYSSLES
jgi:hypothetical protein